MYKYNWKTMNKSAFLQLRCSNLFCRSSGKLRGRSLESQFMWLLYHFTGVTGRDAFCPISTGGGGGWGCENILFWMWQLHNALTLRHGHMSAQLPLVPQSYSSQPLAFCGRMDRLWLTIDEFANLTVHYLLIILNLLFDNGCLIKSLCIT